MNLTHQDNGQTGEFNLIDEESTIGEIYYSWLNSSTIVITHTEVDENYKGQGLGKKLVQACVDFARKNHLKIIPVCPFAKAIMENNPEFEDVVI